MSYNLHFLFKKMEENGPFVDREKTQHGRIWDLVPFYPPAHRNKKRINARSVKLQFRDHNRK